ncbi:MAG: 2Fe-2S iron-sulfur cluster binding domain-containing protein [Erysipelotrichaceae bacterium]|nr:2Fe-2S iron-sulfur cluster binding domain-containing protein [Erysipelotrichaceae bacterium]
MIFRKSDIPGEDIKRAMSMADKRRQLIKESPATALEYDYGVNRLAKSLHPGIIEAAIEKKERCGTDSCRITLNAKEGKFPYFRAGEFITLSSRVSDSFLSRPYSIASSPKEALKGRIEIIVQRKGIFSNYLIDEAPIKKKLAVGEPSGDFYHDSLRDRGHILAVAGGSGITPFISMMKAIKEGSEDFRLTLVYGVRKREMMLIDPEEYRDERIRIITVLSDEIVEGYRHGLINGDILKEYIDEDTSVFMCGPDAMYHFVRKQLEEIGFDQTRIRQERNSTGDRTVEKEEVYKIIVHIRDSRYEIDARNDETIITAMERAGIPALVRCRNGVCGFCHSRVIKGDYFIAKENDFRRSADVKFDYIHPCSTYPESDMEIEIPIFNV